MHLASERVLELDDDEALDLLESMGETCAQDVASSGETSMDDIAVLMGLARRTVYEAETSAKRRILREQVMPEFPEHPEDPYVRYSLMGEDELADVAAILRAREKGRPREEKRDAKIRVFTEDAPMDASSDLWPKKGKR